MDFLTHYKKIALVAGLLVFFFAHSASAANSQDFVTFNVSKDFDVSARNQVDAQLIKTTDNLYFYVEKSWWNTQPQTKQQDILNNLDLLSQEFKNKIYPTLTSLFGSEWKPGVDGDPRISVFFESMNSAEGGYFNEADEYLKLQIPTSNEREMLYLSLDNIDNFDASKKILAHEFTHLITFNQKNKMFGLEEDTWLNEARADYSSTILGYDDTYQGSNLQQRVNSFIQNPSDSITEWQGTQYDYASVSLFTHYLVDHYGVTVLSDSLKSKFVGVDSITYALQKSGVTDSFNQIFTNWVIASVINDCSANTLYCYFNQNLKNFRLAPSVNFLPLTGNVSLSVTNVTKNLSGNWLKFIGGNGDLELDFSTLKGLDFQVPYIVTDSAGTSAVKFLTLDQNETGKITLPKFGTDYKYLILMPILESSFSQSGGSQPTYPYTYSISIKGQQSTDQQSVIQQLLDRIAYLKLQIANIQSGGASTGQCSAFSQNLFFGMKNNSDVNCLQQFLKSQGSDIYPSGLVTGNFGALTKAAVVKFQEKYAADILTPVGLSQGTGYVGATTRAKINQLLQP